MDDFLKFITEYGAQGLDLGVFDFAMAFVFLAGIVVTVA